MAQGDLTAFLRRLTPVKKGMDLLATLTAERIQAIQDAIIWLASGVNIRTSGGITKRQGSGYVLLSGNDGSAQSAVSAEGCPLAVGYESTGDTGNIVVSWGTIVNMQPTGFHAGGVPVFKVPVNGQGEFFVYAVANGDARIPAWTSAEIRVSRSGMEQSTRNSVKILIASVGVRRVGNTMVGSVVQGQCGPITANICQLRS